METNKTHKVLYNSPVWEVLAYILQHPDLPVRGSHLVKALPHISKSAIYNAIQMLEKIGVAVKEKGQESYMFNRDSIGLRSLMRFHIETLLQPLIKAISDLASKIILFGSRATGDYDSDSDFDLFVVTAQAGKVRQIVGKSNLAAQIQLLVKTPEEWIDLYQQDPELYQSIQKGIVLWDQSSKNV